MVAHAGTAIRVCLVELRLLLQRVAGQVCRTIAIELTFTSPGAPLLAAYLKPGRNMGTTLIHRQRGPQPPDCGSVSARV
jgi:hypothetical protein